MPTLTRTDPANLLERVTLVADHPDCVVLIATVAEHATTARLDTTCAGLVLVLGDDVCTVDLEGLPFPDPVWSFDAGRRQIVATVLPAGAFRGR